MIYSLDLLPHQENNPDNKLKSGLFVPQNYKSGELLTKTAPLELLKIEKPELKVLPAEAEAPIIQKKEKGKEIDKNYLYFLSNPWNYFESIFEEYGIESPTSEIQSKLDAFKKELPQVSSASLILIKSPFEHIRNLETKRLAKRGITTEDIGKLLMSETQIIRPHSLDFSQNHESTDLDRFNLVLAKILEDILIIDGSIDVQIEHIATLSRYLSTLSETMMYSSGNFKMNNPALLDKIAEQVEFLIETNLTDKNKKQLKTLFDFLSYFEMNNSNASGIFLNLATKKDLSHPLIHELRYQLKINEHTNSEQSKLSTEKVGIEIEGSPIVLFKKLPKGFEFGIDGGYTMPELRRRDDSLYFDEEYKKQLFELWYWFKMGKFKAASIHLQIDDPAGAKMKIFQEKLGTDFDSVRKNEKSSMRTVELRFNLSAYKDIDDEDTVFDISSPFVAEQYELIEFIELILKIGNGIDEEKIKKEANNLPDFWKSRLTKEVKKTDFKKFMRLARRSSLNWVEISSGISNLSEPLTINQLIQVLKLSESDESWHEDEVVEAAFNKFNEKLDFKQVMRIARISDWENKTAELALNALNGLLTLEQAVEMAEESGWTLMFVEQAFSKIDKDLNIEEIIALGDRCNWDWRLISAALNKLSGNLTIEQALYISEKSHWDSDVGEVAFEKISGKLTLEQIINLINRFHPNPVAISKLFDKLDGTLSYEQILDITESGGRSWDLTLAALRKLEGKLTFKQVKKINSRSGDSHTVTAELLTKLDRTPNFRQAIEFADRYYWKPNITIPIISKLEGALNLAKILHIGDKCDWDVEIIAEIIKKLGEKLKPKQFIKLARESHWDAELFEAAINALDIEALKIEDIKLIINSIPNQEDKIVIWALFSQKDLKFPIFLHEMVSEEDDEDDRRY